MHKIVKVFLVVSGLFLIIFLIGIGLTFLKKIYFKDINVDLSVIEGGIPEDQLESLKFDRSRIEEIIKGGNFSDIPDIDSLLPSGRDNDQPYVEYVTPDGNLKLQYPSNWLKIEGEGLKSASQIREEKYGTQIMFLATSLDMNKFGQLIIEKKGVDTFNGFEEIIEKMKENNEKGGWTMEILNQEIAEKEISFEARYSKEDRLNNHSKEKVLLLERDGEKTIYSVAFISFEKDWQDYEVEADFSIGSASFNE